MRKQWILIAVSFSILLCLFVRGVLLELDRRAAEEDTSLDEMSMAEDSDKEEIKKEDYEAAEKEEQVIKNVWILSTEGQTIRFLHYLTLDEFTGLSDEKDCEESLSRVEELPVVSEPDEPLADVVADLYIQDEEIYRIVLKPEQITGKVIRLDRENAFLELEGYGGLPLEENVGIYDLREAEEGNSKLASIDQVVIGYDAADYVVADGQICAILIRREIQPENIRVLIRTTGYEKNYHDTIRVHILGSGKAVYQVDARETKSKKLADGKELTFRPDCKYLQGGRCVLTAKEGIVVESVERSQGNPTYMGCLEILQTESGLLLVNEVSIEEYLRGVLPSEMPASFPKEALRVQAVCARSYACRQILESGCQAYGAHVDDSVAYQVYQNVAADERTDEAVKSTAGQILSWEGQPALTSYFSTSCGMTSPAEKVWPGMEEVPYLIGQWQGEEGKETASLTLSDEKTFRKFLLGKDDYEQVAQAAWESEVGWYRWKTEISLEHLEKNLNAMLLTRYRATPEYILTWQEQEDVFVSIPVDTVGNVEKVQILTREKEGLVTAIEIQGNQNRIRVYGEYNIRVLLAPISDTIIRKDKSELSGASMLPSAYMLVEEIEENGHLTGIRIRGGGYGHGTGMSQYGAKVLAEQGKTYQEILTHYYPGTELMQY